MNREDLNKPTSPFVKVGKKPISPFYKVEDEINTSERYAILKTTDNGKFVRGNLLYYRFNNVDIYTDIDNAIFVDAVNSSITIKEYSKALAQINPVDPEERQYIILMYIDDDMTDEDIQQYTWESMIGRTAIYDYIVNNIASNYMNPDKSIILTDNVALKDALTVTQFISYLKNGNLVPEDDFNIEEYRTTGDEEDV